MSSTTTITVPVPETYQLELQSAEGPVFRTVLKTEPRNCDPSDVPVIDLAGINGTTEERHELAAKLRAAATNMGFFYIKNHGISSIDAAFEQTKTFFAQPQEQKDQVSVKKSRFYNGYGGIHSIQVSPSESRDYKEGFAFRYEPQYDPHHPMTIDEVPEAVRPFIRGEGFVWEGTSHLPDFKKDILQYWQDCLRLARKLIRIFALSLDLPEDHFDNIVTHPGSDMVLNYYPKNKKKDLSTVDAGIGSHTDLQCFTLLWQDTVSGLQVLTKEGQWLKVPPMPDTIVVNIGDFLMRLSNDRFKSTVHRVYNFAPEDRYSMPFFFGFNFNEECAVLPTCTSESNPAKYKPISCGEVSSMLNMLDLEIKSAMSSYRFNRKNKFRKPRTFLFPKKEKRKRNATMANQHTETAMKD